MCIEIFGLNTREALLDERKKACDQVWLLLKRIMKPGGDREATEQLKEIRQGRRPYSMAQWAALEEAEKNWWQIFEKDEAVDNGGSMDESSS